MRKVADIIDLIEKHAPLAMAAPWDKSGIQVASPRQNVSRLAVVLDPTPEAVRSAIAAGADMMLAHHPLAMQPRFLDKLDAYHMTASLLLCREMPLYSAHTSLDASLDGPVSWLAEALSLHIVAPLEEVAPAAPGKKLPYGFGFYGDLPETMEYPAFAKRLAAALGKSDWLVCGAEPETVRRVACCPGSGSSYAETAHAVGADILITGDVKYHSALETPLRMLDVGHFILEHTMMRRFSDTLARELPDIEVFFIPAEDPLSIERENA